MLSAAQDSKEWLPDASRPLGVHLPACASSHPLAFLCTSPRQWWWLWEMPRWPGMDHSQYPSVTSKGQFHCTSTTAALVPAYEPQSVRGGLETYGSPALPDSPVRTK